MNAHSKDEIREIILKDMQLIHNRSVELSKRLGENLEDNLSYVRELAAQLSQPSTGPLVPKTPKMLRKRAVQRIETIPEDEVFKQDIISSTSSLQSLNEEEQKDSEVGGRRPRRETSKRAAENIKKQSLLNDSVKKVSNHPLCYTRLWYNDCKLYNMIIWILGEEREPAEKEESCCKQFWWRYRKGFQV